MLVCRSLIAILLVSLGGPLVAGAPVNLMTNPHFDHDLSGWQLRAGDQPMWTSFDFAGNPASGSVLTANTLAASGTAEIVLTQCIPLPSIGDYFFSTAGYAASGQSTGELYVSLILHPGPQTDCSNGAVFISSMQIRAFDEWRSVSRSMSVQALPATAEIWLRPEKDVTNGSFGGYFDNILLSHDAIFLEGFEPRG